MFDYKYKQEMVDDEIDIVVNGQNSYFLRPMFQQ